ncbi:MAG: vanomycin resistance protein VanB [Pseudonocardiaceae bacterium]|nr:vanomycin resistance protein VanB [Pseudonocardiaceae bacterium]
MPQEYGWPESHAEQTDVLPVVHDQTTTFIPAVGGAGGTTAGSGGTPPRNRRKRALIIAGAVFGVLVMLYLVDTMVNAGDVPRGVSVAGVDVGGMSQNDAEEKLRSELEPRMATPVPVRAGDVNAEVQPRAAGLEMDWPKTLDEAGTQSWNPITRITSFFTNDEVGVVTKANPTAVSEAIEGLRGKVDRGPKEGTVRFEGTEDGKSAVPVAVPPKQGQQLKAEAAENALVEHWVSGRRVALPVEAMPVKTTAEGVQQTVDELVKPAVSAPVLMRGDGKDAELQPAAIAAALKFTPAEKGGRLNMTVDNKKIARSLGPDLASTEQQGRDAQIVFEGGKPTVRPSQHGRGIDWNKSLKPLSGVLGKQNGREIKLTYQDRPAQVTTEEAKGLGIKEVVGEFTTSDFASDSGQNIQRVAEQVNGAIVKPGDTFSLNGHTGPRGKAQGYIEAGVIEDGAPSREVGGGISQFATTLYNASYFAAMKDVEHKEHSYYISRYPEAREATVYQAGDGASIIDLKFQNTEKTGIAIQTEWTPSSITVRLWGTKHVEVESQTGARSNPVPPPTKRKRKGPDCEASSGSPGFTTSDTRTVRAVNGGQVVSRDTRTVRYEPQPKIICQ